MWRTARGTGCEPRDAGGDFAQALEAYIYALPHEKPCRKNLSKVMSNAANRVVSVVTAAAFVVVASVLGQGRLVTIVACRW